MCGLFGAYGNFKHRDIAMSILCLDNLSRGRDSTGISVDGVIYKDIVDARSFVSRPKFRSMVRDGNLILGHTRMATHGDVTVPNAHPFLINGNLIGTHNGIVSNLHQLRTIVGKEYNVDSQYLFAIQDMYGNTDKASGMLNMAFTYRRGNKANKLYLQRHNNSLYLAQIVNDDGSKAYMYSSMTSGLEEAILSIGLNANIFTIPNFSRITIDENGVDSTEYNDSGYFLDDDDELDLYRNSKYRKNIQRFTD